jgi:hypothetical protein
MEEVLLQKIKRIIEGLSSGYSGETDLQAEVHYAIEELEEIVEEGEKSGT